MASANCGASIWNQNFSFDPFGNIQKTVPQGSTGTQFLPTYSPTTNRYQSVPGCTPSYDANGFLTNDCSHTYTWDVAGNPRGVDNVCLVYDALGRMVEQQRGASCGSPYTEVVYSPGGGKLALMNGQTLVKAFVPLPMGASAVYVPTTGLAYYRRADWLGSARLVSKPDGSLYYKTEYAPYGENYHGASGSGGSQVLEFTGQNQDTVGGLYDFMFREYNTNHGRWPWPDPAGMGVVSVESPQTWNRYAYVTNSPLTAVDPLGLDPHWAKMDALRNGSSCFSLPGCSTYMINGMVVPERVFNAYILGQGGSGLEFAFDPHSGIGGPTGKTLGELGDWQWETAYYKRDCAGFFTNCGPLNYVSGGWKFVAAGGSGSLLAANNGSWLQKGLDYLKNHPVFISVNEIVAAQITVQWSTKTVCANLGAGASVPPTKAVTVGVYNAGNMSNWTNVLSSWGYSFGANLILGYQASTNSSGTIGGPTISGVGLSGSYTYGGCTTIP